MKICIVSRIIAYDGREIYATFSTKEKAEWFLRYVPKITIDGEDLYVIRRFERMDGLSEYFKIEEYKMKTNAPSWLYQKIIQSTQQ